MLWEEDEGQMMIQTIWKQFEYKTIWKIRFFKQPSYQREKTFGDTHSMAEVCIFDLDSSSKPQNIDGWMTLFSSPKDGA